MLLLSNSNIEVPLQKDFSYLYHRVLFYSEFETDTISHGKNDVVAIFEPRTSRVFMKCVVKRIAIVRKNGTPLSFKSKSGINDLFFIKKTNRLFHFSHKISSPMFDKSIILKRMYAKIGSRRVNYRGTIDTFD